MIDSKLPTLTFVDVVYFGVNLDAQLDGLDAGRIDLNLEVHKEQVLDARIVSELRFEVVEVRLFDNCSALLQG